MTHYLSYLLRIWHQGTDGENSWRVTLESTATHEVVCFNSMQGLTDFLGSVSGEAASGQTADCNTQAAQHG